MKITTFILLIGCMLSKPCYSQTTRISAEMRREELCNSMHPSEKSNVMILFINPSECAKCVDDFNATVSCLMNKFSLKPVALVEGERFAALKVFKRKFSWKYRDTLVGSDMRASLGLRPTTRVAFLSNDGAVLLVLDDDQFLSLTCSKIASLLAGRLPGDRSHSVKRQVIHFSRTP